MHRHSKYAPRQTAPSPPRARHCAAPRPSVPGPRPRAGACEGLDSGKVVAHYPTLKPRWIVDKILEHGDEQVIVWVTFDHEGDQIAALVNEVDPGSAMHLSGKTKRTDRDETIEAFRAGGGPRVLILKPAMFGFGVNLQSCHVQIFSTITDSFERYHQCVRRSLRYGQTKPVLVYVPITQLDDAICQNTMNKQAVYSEDARAVEDAVVARLRPADTSEVRNVNITPDVEIARTQTDRFTMIHGDCIAHLRHLASLPAADRPVFDLSVFSPPFAALYAYSKSLGDMGNVRADVEFRLQWQWFAEALLPLMRPGRVVAIHAKEIIKHGATREELAELQFPAEVNTGSKIIDAGYRTFQKETAADFRLNVATELMEEAKRRAEAQPPAKEAEKPATEGEQSPPLGSDSADLEQQIDDRRHDRRRVAQHTRLASRIADRAVGRAQAAFDRGCHRWAQRRLCRLR